jgi:dienelactone hydrolase
MENNMPTEVELSKEVVDGIPVIKCYKKEARRKPLVVLSHGFRGNKESWIPYLQTLAKHGYYAIALDNKRHGERQEPDFVSQVFQGERLKVHEVRRLINETAEDVSRLIDYFVRTTEVDQNRIGMSGVSMGGFTTFRGFVIQKRIKVAAPIITSPYWDDIPQGVPIADDAESRQALDTIARVSSPALFPERFPHRPLLIHRGAGWTL